MLIGIMYFKVLSSENLRGSKLGSNERFWFTNVVLGIIFTFYWDTMLDFAKNMVPSVQHKR